MAANLTMVRIATKLDDLFNEKIDISDVKTSDDDRSTFYSRAIAALSIMIQCGIDETLSGSCVTDGYHDMGIDAVYNDSTQKKLEASMASRFFYCPETLFSLIFSLIVPQASETLLINCSIRSALSCFICFVTCP